MIPATLLKHTAKTQERTQTQDTAGQLTETWADDTTNIKCLLQEIGSTERAGNKIYIEATHRLFMQKISDLDIGKHRLVVTDKIATRTYDILAINDAGGQGHHLELILKIVKY